MSCEYFYQLTLRKGKLNPFGMAAREINPVLMPAGFEWLQEKISPDFFIDRPEVEGGNGFVVDNAGRKRAVIVYEFDPEADMVWIGGITPRLGLLTQSQLLMIKEAGGVGVWETRLRLKELKCVQDISRERRNFDTRDMLKEIGFFLAGVAFEEFLIEEFHCRDEVISPRRADRLLRRFGLGPGMFWTFSGSWSVRELAED